MFALVKLILTFFSDEPKLPLILKAGTSPNIKKLFLLLTAWDDELLSPRKIIIFLAVSLSTLFQHELSNVIPYPLYTYFSLSLNFTILVAPIK